MCCDAGFRASISQHYVKKWFMMGLLQYKPKPYVVGCIEHPDECRFSLHEQDQSRRLLQQLTPLSDLLLLTTLPSSVILFIQTNGSHRNWLLCSLCSLGERGHAHSPPGFVLSNTQGWFILLYSLSPAHEAFSFDLMFSSCNSARPKHFGGAAKLHWFAQWTLWKVELFL